MVEGESLPNETQNEQIVPLIAAQPGIWIADKLSSFDNAYTVVHYLSLQGELDASVLCEAIEQGMAETDTLQMEYGDLAGDAVQIKKGVSILPHPVQLDMRTESGPFEAASDYMKKDMDKSTRIESGNPLIHHALLQISPENWIWYQRYHHIQLDAYSFTALTRRMVEIYSAKIRHGVASPHPFTPIEQVAQEYADYRNSSKYEKDSIFWKKLCSELPPAYSLRPIAGAEPSKNIIRSLKVMNHENFLRLCELGSPSDMAMALVATWLMKLCNCDAMSLGVIFMRRLGSAALNAAGAFINVLPMGVHKRESIVELAADISKSLKLIRRHQKYDSEQIVRDTGRTWENEPLFGPVINYKAFEYHLDFEGIQSETHHVASGPIRDIEIVIYVDNEKQLTIEYLANGDRYDKKMLDSHLERLDLMLSSSPSLILPWEEAVINKVNETHVSGHEHETLVSLLNNQALSTPDAIALKDNDGGSMSYAAAQRLISKLASAMQTMAGVRKGDIVAVQLPRSMELSVALQAVLLAGAAYLPLDPGYPEERLAMMVDDAKPKLIINHGTLASLLKYSDNDAIAKTTNAPTPDDIAYIIYTSGSTGKPKGVMVSHRAIVNRLLWMQDTYQLQQGDVVLQKTPSSFDVSVWEFFWPLISGATCVMAPPDCHRDPELVRQLIVDHGVTTIHFVPSMLSTFLTSTDSISKSLKRTFCSGEALPVSLAKKWELQTGIPLYNLYGPTEAAVDVTYYPAFGKHLTELTGTTAPIGFPVWNTEMYVLDSNKKLLPPTIAGELYIGGVQLAQGYLHRPELTSEKFVEISGQRLYKTGDVARWLESGPLEFLGRIDDQVKLRGQRIELGEIDAAMESLKGISQAVTQPQILTKIVDDTVDSRQLVGFIVAREPLDLNWVRSELAKMLPPYMVPVKFVELDKLPLNASGKLDRRGLPLATSADTDDAQHREFNEGTQSPGRKPAHGLEQTIAAAYEALLKVPAVYADDDFFSLGGHSLLAVKLAAMLRKDLQAPVTIGQIMQNPRVDHLAAQLNSGDSGHDAGFETILPIRRSEGPTVFCVHPASGFAWQFSVLRRYLDAHWSLTGVQSTQPDGALGSAESLDDVVEAHYNTITSCDPEGPYYLLGYSLGGTLAHSLAAKIEREGKKVAFLGLLDTWPPETQNWDAKRGENILDQAVVDEMNRERQQFLEVTADDGFSTRMFDAIEANYSTAVRLLVTARSTRFEGITNLFVAERTLPAHTDLQQVWKKWTQTLKTHPVNCSHIDIIHPKTFETLGPQINAMLADAYSNQTHS